ncbi:MAG: hypothetical protein J0H61_12315 [Alphaproteobacteria bacterium]|nr:hypothetical protein [Alphaproteobacteria bacterium]
MTASAKFTFDTEFRGPSDVVSDTARARQKQTLTVEEIEAMCAKAEAKGAAAASARAAENMERTTALLIVSLRAALDNSHAEIETLRAEAARLALATARKIAGAVLAACPAGEVEHALREAMHQALGEPRITLRAAPDVIAALEAKIAAGRRSRHRGRRLPHRMARRRQRAQPGRHRRRVGCADRAPFFDSTDELKG